LIIFGTLLDFKMYSSNLVYSSVPCGQTDSPILYLVCSVVVLHSLGVAVDLVTSGQVGVVARVGLEAAHSPGWHGVDGLGEVSCPLKDDLLR